MLPPMRAHPVPPSAVDASRQPLAAARRLVTVALATGLLAAWIGGLGCAAAQEPAIGIGAPTGAPVGGVPDTAAGAPVGSTAGDSTIAPSEDASGSAPATVVVEAVVTAVLEEGARTAPDGAPQPFQRLEVRFLEGASRGRTQVVENGQFSVVNYQPFGPGDRLLLSETVTPDGAAVYQISDVVRRDAMMLLAAVFVCLTLLIGRLRGLASLVSLTFSFAVVFAFILPRIAAGSDPILVSIAAAAIIIPVSFYLSHGLNRKTTSAVIGTLAALVVTALLARAEVRAARLTGFSSEEALFLQTATTHGFDMSGLLLAGIIIGLLGVLDDITIAQAAVVNQLSLANPGMPVSEMLRRAMDVGTDHIASLVNTLVLVYTSTAMPLLLLFTMGAAPFKELINYEIVAEAVVRALVASIGLILAVPITTVVAALYLGRKPEPG